MAAIHNSERVHDLELKADIEKYVLKNLKREEILDFVRYDNPNYA